jgi:glycosyltransferase involved in cell wall biosynthesis
MPDDPEPLVSVIIPTRNRAHYLGTAVSSALQQTYSNLEIIVSDNASSDDTCAMMARIDDSRVRYQRHEHNIGSLLNFLSAVRESHGMYVAILHDDDMWEPTFVEKLVTHLEADTDLVVAFSDQSIMDETGSVDHGASEAVARRYQRHRVSQGVHRPFGRLGLIWQSIAMYNAAIVRRSAIDWDDFPLGIDFAYDYWLTYLACRTGGGAYYHPERLARYRVHTRSYSQAVRGQPNAAMIFCLSRILQDAALVDIREELKRKYYQVHYAYGLQLLRTGRADEARGHLWMKLHHAPGLRGAVAFLLSVLPPRYGRQLLERRQ